MPSFILNGITYDSDNSQLVQAVAKYVKDAEEEKTELEKKLEEEKKKTEAAEEALDEAEEEKKEAEKSEVKDAALEKLINDRATKKAILISEASAILGDKMPKCLDCDLEIMKAVIGDEWAEDDIMGKSDDYKRIYADALYKVAVKKHADVRKKTLSFGNEILSKDGKIVTRDSARVAYMKTLGEGVNL